MRTALIVFAWVSLVGSLFDGAIIAFHIWLALAGEANWSLSVYAFFQAHLPWLLWVKDVAYAILPHDFVDWVFDLPNLAYFPVRIMISVLAGWLALRWADRLR
jgi:hypothetical protein